MVRLFLKMFWSKIVISDSPVPTPPQIPRPPTPPADLVGQIPRPMWIGVLDEQLEALPRGPAGKMKIKIKCLSSVKRQPLPPKKQ